MSDDGPPLGVREWLIIVGVCGLSFLVARSADSGGRLYRTTPLDAPLVRIEHDFFSDADFASLAACAADHPLLGSNPLDAAFSATRGLLVRFTAAGLDDLRADARLACLAPYVDAVRLDDANAFVLNVVSSEPSSETPPVGWHIDQSFPLHVSFGHFVADFVSVLYVRVPPDMVGGELELKKLPEKWLDHHGLAARSKYGDRNSSGLLATTVAPRLNTLLTFRGDAHHRVKPFTSDPASRRVSLVLEQYRLPTRLLSWRSPRLFVKGH